MSFFSPFPQYQMVPVCIPKDYILSVGDLSASEMTMCDEDRMQLMILVKEGKISMHQAVDAVSKRQMFMAWMSAKRK